MGMAPASACVAPTQRTQPDGFATILRLVGALLHVDPQLVHVLDVLFHDRLVMQATPARVRSRASAAASLECRAPYAHGRLSANISAHARGDEVE